MTRTRVERTRRFGLRCLVVSGFAVAAWLLTSSAAHAAQDNVAPAGSADSSVLNLVTEVGGGLLGDEHAVPTLLDAATAVMLPAPDPGVVAGKTFPSASAGAPAGVPHQPGDADLLCLVGGLVAPVALADLVTASADLVGPLPQVLDSAVGPVYSAVPRAPAAQTLRSDPAGRPHLAVAHVAARPAAAGGTAADPARFVASRIGAHTTIHTRSSAGAGLPPAHPDGVSDGGHRPGHLPDPTPLQGHLATGGGSSTAGSNAHSDSGACAVASSSVAGGAVEAQRLSKATDVAVLRLDAEDRTFSPD